MISHLRWPLLLVIFIASGCSTLKKSQENVLETRNCPSESAAQVLQRAAAIGPRSPDQEIACALDALIASKDPSVQKSPVPARLSLHLSERETPGSTRDRHIQKGIQLAENSLKNGGDQDAAVHYYLGALLGLWLNDHPLDAGTLLSRVENELVLAGKLSKAIDDGGPSRLLGMIYLKAPPWPAGIGDGDKALELLHEAATAYPQHPLNHAFYALALLEVDNKKEEARSQRDLGLKTLQNDIWGYNRTIWQREFDSLQKDLGS